MTGWPGWRRTISLGDIWNDPELSDMEKAWEITKRLRKSEWIEESDDAYRIVDELAWISNPGLDMAQTSGISESELLEDWNYFWDELYDVADSERVWLDLFSRED